MPEALASTTTNAWAATRLSDALKRRLIDYFVLGVPAYERSRP
ncbi:MAG TPA: hypothetical protein VFS10_02150 [Pyrinomonadaceae bacterium]|nr:hypothetical protein [Pyrinomonadaceae bacterium]